MNKRSIDYEKILTATAFWMVLLASLFFLLSPPPEGPWAGIYRSFWPMWLCLLLATCAMLVRIYSPRPVSWGVVLIFGITLVSIIVATSLSWGQPYGFRDVWVHYETIRRSQLSPRSNAYPAFHAFVIALGSIFSYPPTTVLRYVALLASLIATFWLAIVLQVLPISHQQRQSAFIAGLPALFLGFTPRPFTLAIPYVLFFLWVTHQQSALQRLQGLALLVPVMVLPIHPTMAIISGLLLTTIAFIDHIRNRIPLSRVTIDPLPNPFPARSTFILFIGIATISYLMFYVFFGQRIVSVLLSVIEPEASAQSSNVASGPSYLTQLRNNPLNILEVFSRLAYVLACLLLIGVAWLKDILIRDRISAEVAIIGIITVKLVAIFAVVDVVLKSTLVNLTRLPKFLPLLLVTVIGSGLPRSRRLLSAFVALLVFTAGIGVAYPSTYTGGVAISATDEQVQSVEWIDEYEYENMTVIGTRQTLVIAHGIVGLENTLSWVPDNGSRTTPIPGNAKYPWLITDPAANSIVVIDGGEVERAKQEAHETGDNSALTALDRYPQHTSIIYTNEDVTIYKKQTSTSIGPDQSNRSVD